MAIDWSRVPPDVHKDIADYVGDNNLGSIADLDPKTAFHYWLQYNGLIGYTESILEAGETLGLFVVQR